MTAAHVTMTLADITKRALLRFPPVANKNRPASLECPLLTGSCRYDVIISGWKAFPARQSARRVTDLKACPRLTNGDIDRENRSRPDKSAMRRNHISAGVFMGKLDECTSGATPDRSTEDQRPEFPQHDSAPIARRTLLKVGAESLAGVLAAPYVIGNEAAAEENIVYVNTWGGSWTAAEDAAFYKPFTQQTGIAVRTVAPMNYAKIKAIVQTHNYEWDVSGSTDVEAKEAQRAGLLEPIDYSVLHKELIPQGNIIGDTLAGVALGTCLVYRKDKFPNGGPQSWADFWDVKRFPGYRCLYNRSFTALAFALLADGVPVDQIYPMDLDRAFKKLDEIKPYIKVWWTQATQSQQLIADGEVDMIGMWNARAQELIDRGQPLEIVWNGCENSMAYKYVLKGTPRAKQSWKYLEFISQPEPQAKFCTLMSYGPSNPKAFDLISPADARRMPTNPEYIRIGYKPNGDWLAPRMNELRERFAQWLVS
jgi:putative spermidine/putrescine transport system substrate-binding protein